MAIDKEKPKSAAPKTAEERAGLRPIGLKHGLSSLVLSTESEADFQALLDSYEAEHKPSTATEKALVAQLAATTWRLRRLHNIEAGLYKLNRSGPLALVADGADKALTILARQQARLERSFNKALRELERLQNRRSVKVVTQSEKQPVRSQQFAQPTKPPIPIMTNIPRS
jgi:hypothetical protein